MKKHNTRTINEVGNKYGQLTVIEYYDSYDNRARWRCICECGNEVITSGVKLRKGLKKSCGCLVYNNLLGNIYGRLTVIEQTDKRESGNIMWKCLCECGEEKLVESTKLVLGLVRSCGCLRRDTHWKGYKELSLSYFNSVRSRANYKNIPFTLTIEEVWDLFIMQKEKCAISGLAIELKGNKTASLDRINSSMGYTLDNVQWVHKNVNSMKQNFEQNAFISMCRIIADNNKIIYNYEESNEWLTNCREVREDAPEYVI